MTVSRLEQIVHVLVAKPIAWTIYGLWRGAILVYGCAFSLGRWARSRWVQSRASKEPGHPSVA